MMGLEEHLIGMFRHDFEFIDGHQSHLGHLGGNQPQQPEKQLEENNTAIAQSSSSENK